MTMKQTEQTPEEVERKLERYLQEHHVATLATASGDSVWAAAVFYVSDGHHFYFLSSPTSRHCDNLTRNPRVALTVQEDYADWPAIKGVQLEGIASEITGQEAELARSLYGKKFPLVGRIDQAPETIVRAMSKVHWYKVVPSKLYFIDNSVGFGHRDEIAL